MEKSAERSLTPMSVAALPPELQGVFLRHEYTVQIAQSNPLSPELDGIRRMYGGRAPAECHDALVKMTGVIGDSGLSQDQRDAALVTGGAVLKAHALDMDRASLLDAYTAAVEHLDGRADYYSGPLSLHEWGEELAKEFGPATDYAQAYLGRMQLRAAWSQYL